MHIPKPKKERDKQVGIQRILNHTGDTAFKFDPTNAAELAEAEKRFRFLTGVGFTGDLPKDEIPGTDTAPQSPRMLAAEKTGDGTSKQVKEFNPNAMETVFHPHIVGG